jgi:hypothetical protein
VAFLVNPFRSKNVRSIDEKQNRNISSNYLYQCTENNSIEGWQKVDAIGKYPTILSAMKGRILSEVCSPGTRA